MQIQLKNVSKPLFTLQNFMFKKTITLWGCVLPLVTLATPHHLAHSAHLSQQKLISQHLQQNGFIIKKIEIAGLQRINRSSVLGYLPVKSGQRFRMIWRRS